MNGGLADAMQGVQSERRDPVLAGLSENGTPPQRRPERLVTASPARSTDHLVWMHYTSPSHSSSFPPTPVGLCQQPAV